MSSEYNPYSAPVSAVEDRVDPNNAELASKGVRFGTLLIDYICFLVVSFLIGVIAVLLFGPAGSQGLKKIPPMLLGYIVMFAFYVFFEGVWARTPGKFILGTIVVNANGAKPSFGQIVGRTLCRFIPFEPFSFFGEEGWHDSIPKTRVVRIRK
jgi:uncharacterized RDD family membrane protein YckC